MFWKTKTANFEHYFDDYDDGDGDGDVGFDHQIQHQKQKHIRCYQFPLLNKKQDPQKKLIES